ncbi:hypothetical protein KPL70_019818 [Citrus sinensis]|uniref:Late embryogenesis abundant protein, LEA-18 n=2 Tax=Citrus clementina TaxID=85681 RepID=V4SFD8_CITCL|nr:uncharacterized protein LOC102616141 [Citrus sinensis]ESR39282.1 hypothetical protein CICLE_v10026786mg [Citrus x clementina]KAH9663860.1 hypothetical protein KPL70_019818 [Citrus sinensis]
MDAYACKNSSIASNRPSENKGKMEKKQEQETERKKSETERSTEEKKSLEGLPMKDSPYVKYKDLEDYKRQGYGTEGHLKPQTGRGGGATDAPTLSGDAVASGADVSGATDAINRQGVP